MSEVHKCPHGYKYTGPRACLVCGRPDQLKQMSEPKVKAPRVWSEELEDAAQKYAHEVDGCMSEPLVDFKAGAEWARCARQDPGGKMNSIGRKKSPSTFQPLWMKKKDEPLLCPAETSEAEAMAQLAAIQENYWKMVDEMSQDFTSQFLRGEDMAGEAGCTHDLKEYVGFTESYHYCTKCNEKVP